MGLYLRINLMGNILADLLRFDTDRSQQAGRTIVKAAEVQSRQRGSLSALEWNTVGIEDCLCAM